MKLPSPTVRRLVVPVALAVTLVGAALVAATTETGCTSDKGKLDAGVCDGPCPDTPIV